MKVSVETNENHGNDSYKKIAEELFKESQISTNIEEVKIKFYPSKPLFFLGVKIKGAREPTKVKEIADIKETSDGVKLFIKDEKFANNLLSMLWEKFGKSKIEQPDRLEILGKEVGKKEIKNLELIPEEEIEKTIFSIMWQVLPEGFRTRRSFSTKQKKFSVIATENEMKESWIEEGKKLHNNF